MMRAVTRVIAVVAVAVGVGAALPWATFAASSAGGAAATERPDAFLTRILHYESLGQWGRAYDLLVPGQKRLINRGHYVDCETANGPTFDVVSTKRLDQYREPINVLGVPQKMATAVTMRVTVRAAGKTSSFTTTWHTLWEQTHWAWMLGTGSVRTLHSGGCP
jgi:hypothetical protein